MLAATDDLGGGADTSGTYGPDEVEAVRRFQRRHSLAADGILGSETLAALNTPMSHRLREIELALEWLRWIPPLAGHRFVVVNIPAFELFAFDSTGGTGVPALGMKVVVGKVLDTRTPLLFEADAVRRVPPLLERASGISWQESCFRSYDAIRAYLRAHDMELVGPRDRVVW